MQYFALFHVPPNIRPKTINRTAIILFVNFLLLLILSPHQIPICYSIFVFKLYHKTCEQFYRNFGLYEKSPNSFLPGLSRSIINQFRFHNLLCLCLASVHLPYPFHLVSASVSRSRRFASPAPARSAPCGFVPLRQS